MSEPHPHVLVVEDDENLRLVLSDNLEDEGYRVEGTASGREGLERGTTGAFDLLVLDIMLPDLDGYSVCRQLRERGVTTPVLMLTARTLEDDLVTGLDAGADDYLAKPYRLRELLARVRALLRRRSAPAPLANDALGAHRLDRRARLMTDASGQIVDLTPTELDLVAFLLEHAGEALSRNAILDAVWGEGIVVAPRTVDNFVSSLKKKLGWTAAAPWAIETVRGFGYRLRIDVV